MPRISKKDIESHSFLIYKEQRILSQSTKKDIIKYSSFDFQENEFFMSYYTQMGYVHRKATEFEVAVIRENSRDNVVNLKHLMFTGQASSAEESDAAKFLVGVHKEEDLSYKDYDIEFHEKRNFMLYEENKNQQPKFVYFQFISQEEKEDLSIRFYDLWTQTGETRE